MHTVDNRMRHFSRAKIATEIAKAVRQFYRVRLVSPGVSCILLGREIAPVYSALAMALAGVQTPKLRPFYMHNVLLLCVP